jgi:hypothetical protein
MAFSALLERCSEILDLSINFTIFLRGGGGGGGGGGVAKAIAAKAIDTYMMLYDSI